MKNGFKIIDSDMHIMEPMDLWEKYMESRFKDHAPRPVGVPSRGDLSLLILDGKEPRAKSPTLANDVRMISGRRSNTRVDAIDFARKRGFDAKSQLEAMDIEGIDVAVLFPTACLHIMTMPDMDPHLAEAICRAYNNWLYDFCRKILGGFTALLSSRHTTSPSRYAKHNERAKNWVWSPRFYARRHCRGKLGSASIGKHCGPSSKS